MTCVTDSTTDITATSPTTQGPTTQGLATAAQLIAEAAAGRMFVLADDEDRENEGDVVIPAAACDAAAINFMATHARGLVCLAVDQTTSDRLGLTPMAPVNRSQKGTAFMAGIDAAAGVTTGISAADRARTIAIAADPASAPADLVSPGHVFPVLARPGGVLERRGHTEASVDICRLAGSAPAAVICEIMNPDGTMARLPDLLAFAKRFGLLVGRVADLVDHIKNR